MKKAELPIRLILAFVPFLATTIVNHLTHDIISIFFVLLIVYFTCPLIFSLFISKFELNLETHRTHGMRPKLLICLFFLLGFALIQLIVFVPLLLEWCSASLYHFPVPFVRDGKFRNFLLAYVLVFSSVLIVFEEVYFRLFIGKSAWYFEIAGVTGFALNCMANLKIFLTLNEDSREWVLIAAFCVFGTILAFVNRFLNLWASVSMRLGFSLGVMLNLVLIRNEVLVLKGISIVLANHPLNMWTRFHFF